MGHSKSFLDLINECDSFPHNVSVSVSDDADQRLYRFMLPEDPHCHGYILPKIVQSMPWTSDFLVDHDKGIVQLQPALKGGGDPLTACSEALQQLVDRAIEQDTFRVINKQHSELYPILGAGCHVSIERYASPLFGIVARGAHMTVYTKRSGHLMIWVPSRSATSFSYPNCLDSTVAGGVATGESPLSCIIREAEEEATLPASLVSHQARAAGIVSYMGQTDQGSGGEVGLIHPNLLYVYDLEVDEKIVCQPHDDEVRDFHLMGVEEVIQSLKQGKWKTNSALVTIDFLVRQGLINDDNEYHYAEIVARLHRSLPFPLFPTYRAR